ncbi:MAG: AAA family ATPase [Candidatus Omnitrophica bacterium]|nr:AAA family ATPase [Candidatus Omnitrophota bacterium]
MSFKQIRGNINSIEFLKQIFLNKREACVYLFYGPEGIGKKLIAHNLAKAVNCLKQEEFDSCDECISCRKIDAGCHLDVCYIVPDNSNTIGIAEIRVLKERVYLKSNEARKKVFIIDEAERMTVEAANACLKILEEPTPDCLIILISSKPQLIISTILSRCYKIKFTGLEKNELKKILMVDFNLDEILAHYLAYFCEGRMGRAIQMSRQPDVLIQKNKIIDDFFTSLTVYDNRDFKRDKLKEILEIILSWFRDIYIIKIGISDDLINIDRKEQISKDARHYSLKTVEEIINFICDAVSFLDRKVNPKLLFSNLKAKVKA